MKQLNILAQVWCTSEGWLDFSIINIVYKLPQELPNDLKVRNISKLDGDGA